MLQAITRAEDLVSIQEVNVLGDMKSKFKDDMIQQYLEIKLLKWEAMELVRKANEYAIKAELMHRKEFKKLPDYIQYEAKEKFFIDYVSKMSDEKADMLSEVLDEMIKKHINN
jgi:translation initiation factor IF-2